MLKTFKYSITPTLSQSILLNKHIGASRFVYNLALETKKMAWTGNKVNLSCFELINQLTELKNDCDWLKEINAQSLQQPIRYLDNAFKNSFRGKHNFPKFKKKSNIGSFTIPQNVFLRHDKLFIPKFKEGIEIIIHRPIKGIIKKATIRKTASCKYFVSILCETGEILMPKASINETNSIGIDLGIKTFIVSSCGKTFENPKYLRKAESRLKYIQRKYSKTKGIRTMRKLSLIHEKISNQRKDFLHKTSSELINNHDTICIEDLNVAGMLKNHKLAKSISDASWGEFVRQLEYKADWYGKNVIRIGRFYPSSKTCSNCGTINKDLKLQERVWVCNTCGVTLNRDLNAAINIKNIAINNYLSGEHRLKNRKELLALAEVKTSEDALNSISSLNYNQ